MSKVGSGFHEMNYFDILHCSLAGMLDLSVN